MMSPHEPPPPVPLPKVAPLPPPIEDSRIGSTTTPAAPLPAMDESHWQFVFQDDPDQEPEADDAQGDQSSAN